MSKEEDIYAQVFHKLNQYDQDQIRMDMLVLGTAFVQIDREGNVNRINPDKIYTTDSKVDK